MSAIPPPRDWSTLADFVRTAGPTSGVILGGAVAGMSLGALLLLAIGQIVLVKVLDPVATAFGEGVADRVRRWLRVREGEDD